MLTDHDAVRAVRYAEFLVEIARDGLTEAQVDETERYFEAERRVKLYGPYRRRGRPPGCRTTRIG